MIKSFKKLLVFSVCALVLPMCVKADDLEYSLSLRCDNTTLRPQQVTTCTIILDTTDSSVRVVGFDADVLVTETDGVTQSQKLVLSNFEYNNTNWNGDFNTIANNSFMLTRSDESEPLTGTIEVASFQITAGNETGTAKVLLNNVGVGHQPLDSNEQAQNLANPNSAQILITISTQENNNVDPEINTNNGNEENTNAGTNTNENTNNNSSNIDNTKSASDDKKTESKKPVNPDTGVTLSALGIALLVVGGISYIALRKKNYFNRI